MKFKDMNTIELSDAQVIKSNIFESLLIASKTDKVTFRTTMLTCLLLDFNTTTKVTVVENFLENEANELIKNYMKEYMPNSNPEYLKDLKLEDFDFENVFIKRMDNSFYKLYERICEQVNVYNLDKVMRTLNPKS